ncbi:MAG: EamA family transporter [Acidobacteriota bacterium]
MADRRYRLLLILSLAALYTIWGSTYLAIRFAIETLPPFTMAGVRFMTAGAILYLISQLRGEGKPEPRHWAGAALVGTLLLVGGNGGVVWAETRLDSSLAALLLTTQPFWLVLMAWMMKGGTPPSARTVGGMALGFLGVCLLIAPGGGGGMHVDLLGALVVTLSAISWAGGSVLSLKVPLPSAPILSTSLQMLTGGAGLSLIAVATGEPAHIDPSKISLHSLLALAYLIVFGAIVAYTAFVWLVQNAPPALASTYSYVNPLVAVFLGWALGGEAVSSRIVLAALVIVAGVVVVTLAARKKAAPKQAGAEVVQAVCEKASAA